MLLEVSFALTEASFILFMEQATNCGITYDCHLSLYYVYTGNTKRGSITVLFVDLLVEWFGISCMTTDNFCFYLQNRLIQTSQTGGQRYSDTSPFSIP